MEIIKSCLPDRFSWVIDEKLCGMAVPAREENIQFLCENNVNHLVSLTAESPDVFQNSPNLVVFRCPIKEYAAPTQHQIENCLKFIENSLKGGEAVGVHCKQGIGRTGTILACYFVKFCGMTASEAIAYIRTVRPRNSVDGEERERAVSLFYESCQKS